MTVLDVVQLVIYAQENQRNLVMVVIVILGVMDRWTASP